MAAPLKTTLDTKIETLPPVLQSAVTKDKRESNVSDGDETWNVCRHLEVHHQGKCQKKTEAKEEEVLLREADEVADEEVGREIVIEELEDDTADYCYGNRSDEKYSEIEGIGR